MNLLEDTNKTSLPKSRQRKTAAVNLPQSSNLPIHKYTNSDT